MWIDLWQEAQQAVVAATLVSRCPLTLEAVNATVDE
jgi:hypothetical protein